MKIHFKSQTRIEFILFPIYHSCISYMSTNWYVYLILLFNSHPMRALYYTSYICKRVFYVLSVCPIGVALFVVCRDDNFWKNDQIDMHFDTIYQGSQKRQNSLTSHIWRQPIKLIIFKIDEKLRTLILLYSNTHRAF